MKFTIIGMGVVGQAIYSVLEKRHSVSIIEPLFSRYGLMINKGRSVKDIIKGEFDDEDGFIICVPTPALDNGRCDDKLVSEYVHEIVKYHPDAHILIKSTTSIDTLASFQDLHRVTFAPEFLRGSNETANPESEFRDSNFAIYGGVDGRWWHEIFSQIQTINEVRFLDIATAGFLKYSENAYLATKVIFFNELRHLYDRSVGGNYDAMIEALALDKRIGMSHTQVPGPDGEYGFGGHCLPKDTLEFVEYAYYKESTLELLAMALNINKEKFDRND